VGIATVGWLANKNQEQERTIKALSSDVAAMRSDSAKVASLDVREKCAAQGHRMLTQLGYNESENNFRNHFNVGLNRCFLFVEAIHFGKGNYLTSAFVVDAYEGKRFANYEFFNATGSTGQMTDCKTPDAQGVEQRCRSRFEFDEAVKRLMD
jgi:hypothetical protein